MTAFMQYGRVAYQLGSEDAPGVTVRDIARSLSALNRFTGHTIQPYSVAKHSVYVARLLRRGHVYSLDLPMHYVALYGLVHDVAETVVQDLSAPLKLALGPDGLAAYKKIEASAETALMKVLGIPYPVPDNVRALVKAADHLAVSAERAALMPTIRDGLDPWVEWNMIDALEHCPPINNNHTDGGFFDWMDLYVDLMDMNDLELPDAVSYR